MLLMAFPALAAAQISPGPLAKAHAEFEGSSNCVKCHGLRREPMSGVCLGCHRDVAWLLDRGRGFHAREVKTAKKECASCHPDHAGLSFALIAWPDGSPSRFDHRNAGWALDGKHAEAKCEACHTMKFRVSPVAELSKRRGSAGWLGLETTCASCHRADDVHNNSLGAQCDRCHDARGWKPVPKFDHAKTDYPLAGKHADLECAKCHLAARLGVKPNAEGKRIPVFKPLPFRECSNCHDDPHKGRLSARCSECHAVTRAFNVVDRAEFDHSLTRYKLLGKHRAVKCDACHEKNLTKKDPPFTTCGSCHADAHRGEATLAGKAADCAACHGVDGFTPSTFTVAQHRAAAFPLAGRHEKVKCADCHATKTAIAASGAMHTRLRPAFAKCADCHADAHGAQLASRPGNGTCEACHTDAGWKPSTFSQAAHAKLRLPLDGRHAVIECAACHALTRPGLAALPNPQSFGAAKAALKLPETECVSCHVDPHGARYAKGGAFAVSEGCRGCHGTTSWRPATLDVAQHGRFAFRLEGAHRAAPCVSCHAELKAPHATSTLVLAAKGVTSFPFSEHRTTCQSCHETPHGTQFSTRKDRGACESCHGVASFTPAERFDHETQAAFSLAGAHAHTPCVQCHREERTASGAKKVMYRPLSGKCESCHAGQAPGRPE